MRLSYKNIWGKLVISNLQFNISSVQEQRETLGEQLFKKKLRFSRWNIAYGIYGILIRISNSVYLINNA